jgi:hypothetical protein
VPSSLIPAVIRQQFHADYIRKTSSFPLASGTVQPASKFEGAESLTVLEDHYDSSRCSEQNGSAADSQANCRQAGPTRRLEKLQTAAFASRSRKAAHGPATGTLSHRNPLQRAARWLLHRPKLFAINRIVRLDRPESSYADQLILGLGELQGNWSFLPIFRYGTCLEIHSVVLFVDFTGGYKRLPRLQACRPCPWATPGIIMNRESMIFSKRSKGLYL